MTETQRVSEAVSYPLAKLGSLWALVGVSNWQDLASASQAFAGVMAGLVSCVVLIELVWRKWLRACFERRGWVRRRRRRKDDDRE